MSPKQLPRRDMRSQRIRLTSMFTTVRSQYKPVKPAVIGAVVAAAVIFFYCKSAAETDYAKLYSLGLAMPPKVAGEGGVALGNYAVAAGPALLAWLGFIVVVTGVVYAVAGKLYDDPVMNQEMEDQVNRQRDYELHQAEMMGRSGAGAGPQQPVDPMQQFGQQPGAPGMGYPPQGGYAGNYPPPQAMG